MTQNYYDTERAISEYLLFHYGGYEHRLPAALNDGLRFPARCVSDGLDLSRIPPSARALDLGCAVGRSSFELARHCGQVIGIDYSNAFIAVAAQLRDKGAVDVNYIAEGELTVPLRAVVPQEIDRKRAAFEQGDAMQLRDGLGKFDVVVMANLIDRLREPAKCLGQLPKLVRGGGQLLITSPYTWLAEYTPRENWLGGFERDGKAVHTLDALKEFLAPHFELFRRQTIPFVIREHARKFQLGFPEATLWIRKSP
jgi:putative 4-mercaptohistidine N1-methyltranferase